MAADVPAAAGLPATPLAAAGTSAATSSAATLGPIAAPESGDESEPNWPSATDESAFLNGVREETVLPEPPKPAAAENEAVPPVEELVKQIPAEVRATLDELFRARFSRVMRAKQKA